MCFVFIRVTTYKSRASNLGIDEFGPLLIMDVYQPLLVPSTTLYLEAQ
jgi:hypothetical protein